VPLSKKLSDTLARKSQIAIQYSHRLKHEYPDTWVFWVHASNAARFEQAYRQVATRAEIPGRKDPKADILHLVYDWLANEANGRWLMILDNADDADIFFDQPKESSIEGSRLTSTPEPLARYLPQTPNGSILVTSRNRLAAAKLVGDHHNLIDVGPMDE
jgi:hypothetical protein